MGICGVYHAVVVTDTVSFTSLDSPLTILTLTFSTSLVNDAL